MLTINKPQPPSLVFVYLVYLNSDYIRILLCIFSRDDADADDDNDDVCASQNIITELRNWQ